MDVCSPQSNLSPSSFDLSNNDDRSCPPPVVDSSSQQNPFQGLNELIANLDHELWNVRLRALKCILGKVECSIVTIDYLSRRIDLLHRLSDWLRATIEATTAGDQSCSGDSRGRSWSSVNTDVAVQGIPYILKLLLSLAEYDNVRQFVAEQKLDSVLIRLKTYLDVGNQTLLDTIFQRMSTTSFEIILEGSPDVWADNASNRSILRKNTSTEKSFSYEYDENSGGIGDVLIRRLDDRNLDRNMSDHSAAAAAAGGDSYFRNPSLQSLLNKSWTSTGFHFTIPSVYLTGTDRRVLSSTVESLLSKNEPLVLSTACFFRDVLLYDYPPEVFIQESALCMAFLEVTESMWNNDKITEIATHGLLQLSHVLRIRIMQLNCSEFYETKRELQAYIPNNNQYSGMSSYSSSSHNNNRISNPTSDAFVSTICQILKTLSRTLLFHPKEFHLWTLLDSFSLTICKCAHTFPVDYKLLSLGLQEVLLDLAYCYEKHGLDINSTVMAMVLSSILKALQVNKEVFILAYDVRQCVRKISRCSLLLHAWPEVHEYLVQHASPLVDNLGSSTLTDGEGQNPIIEEACQPREAIPKLLIAIQNATVHQAVIHAIDNLWGYILPLAVNTRLGKGVLDYICKDVPFRDAFYRFLCVEPTCTEDEDLLMRIMNMITYLLSNLVGDERSKIEEWILPLCMENGSAMQRLMSTHCLKPDPPFAGTILPNVLRTLFEFYFTIIKTTKSNPSFAEFEWNLFNTMCLIFHKLGDMGFAFSAVLHPIMKGIATFSSTTAVTAQLTQNPKFSVALILRITELIISLQEHTSGLSGESFRNQGTLYYSTLSLYHLLVVISESKQNMPNSDWIGPCSAVIPCMWDSRDVKIRALGYQICEVLSRKIQGTIALMTVLESPDRIWTSCFNAMTDFEEPAIVKQHAASTLYNLLVQWDAVKKSTLIGKSLILPSWPVFEEFTKLLSHVYWLPTLSEVFGSKVLNDDDSMDEDSPSPQLITPKVLTLICKILIKMKTSSLHPFHPEPFSGIVCSSGLCAMLFRLVGTHSMSPNLGMAWWIDSCSALASVVEALISLCQIDRGISLILIGDKRSMISLIELLSLQPPPGLTTNKAAEETLSTLWVNIFTLLSILCSDSGNNFEDFERCISNQRNIIFLRLIEWLKSDSLAACRRMALVFSHELFSKLQIKQQQQNQTKDDEKSETVGGHPILCREWKDKTTTYGIAIGNSLISVYEESMTLEEKQNTLQTLNALINLSPSAKTNAIQKNVVGVLVMKLKDFGHQYFDATTDVSLLVRKGNSLQWLDETITILSLTSSLVYKNAGGKKSALNHELVDTCHKIFKWWRAYPDRTLLHSFVEALLNFTEEYPSGCQALTFSTNVLGVGPRKAPTPQSILSEILEILQAELNSTESCNLKTVELLFEFLKNATFVLECRNLFVKSQLMQFLINLHPRDMKKWSMKQHRVSQLYLSFLLHTSIHPDMQIAIAKVPEAIDILVLLIVDHQRDDWASILAIQLLRNLSFHPTNRTRLLCDDAVMPSLSSKIRDSENPKEIEYAAVGIWALIANSEKGKLSAKKSLCPLAVAKTITRLRKLEQSSNDLLTEKQDLSNLVNILTTISNLLGAIPNNNTNS